MKNHEAAIKILNDELIRLGGRVLARWLVSQNDETEATLNSHEFMSRMFTGDFKKEEEDILIPYLKPMWEINDSIELLQKDQEGSK